MHQPSVRIPLLALAALALAAPAGAQRDSAAARPPASAPAAAPARANPDSLALAGLRWRNIGPNRGGRSQAVAGSQKRPLEYWFGATGGGLWKTTDGGTTWRPMTDRFLTSSSVGAVAVCEENPDVVYVGMGETELRGNIMQGDGVWKTTDGGKTWAHLGLAETQAIGRIRVHPSDCDRVWVAALGHPYAPNPERGVFRSTDGGRTWQKTLFRNDRTGAVELALTPGRPDVMFAALWEVNRTPWSLSSGGPGSGLFRSTDGGRTWTEITRNQGLPAGVIGKIGVTVSGGRRDRVWAIVEAAEGGVFRSDDGGDTWTRTNDERKLRQRAFYYTRIYADPRDTSTVYVLNVAFHRSTDGGKTFRSIRVPHGDNHDLWIAPDDPKRMVEGNDGGANVSFNGGESWTDQDFPTAQLYHVTTTTRTPYDVCGAQQDNSTVCVPSNGTGREWFSVGGGESGYIAARPDNPDVFYAGSYGGLLTRLDRKTGERRVITVWPENPMGYSSGDIRERFQWTFPIVLAPRNPRVLYVGSQHLWRSRDEGQSWSRISPDLTRHAPETMGPSGGPITLDQTGVETYGTIFSIAPSPRDSLVIWTGSDDGRVHLTRDGGRTWSDVTPPEIAGRFARISLVEASPHAAGKAYVAANRYQMDDRAPYAWRTSDFGRTWTKITAGIAGDDFVRAVREDPARLGMLYAGTEHGVYASWNDGGRWQSIRQGLPDVQVADLVVKDNDLVLGTHGRSFYLMEDISALRQMNGTAPAAAPRLFRPSDAVRTGRGVVVYYNLPRQAQRVTLDFLDARGAVVRTFSGTPADSARGGGGGGGGGDEDDDEERPARPVDPKAPVKAGLNRFVWDLRTPGAEDFPGIVLWAARLTGPRILPGSYRVRLTVDGQPAGTEGFRVVTDPRFRPAPAALDSQFALATRIRQRTTDANRAVLLVRGIRKQIDERLTHTQDAGIRTAAESMKGRLAAIEDSLYNPRLRSGQDPLNYPIRLNNKMAALLGVVESAETAPTRQSYTVFADLSHRIDVQLAALDALVRTDLPRLNALLRAQGLPDVRAEPERPAPETAQPRSGDEEEDEGADEAEEVRDW
ncbi:MAG: VPS10 domain-containing protein [Longimicrobiaceae bacterium]